ncbi:LLM class F420-dependent oxidoreductase [Adhaeribacter arboris]|uniref:LLM class F420-dependent oxidoreductase n=1 Tax=Adhaeribacter arboris TaxID=2072846 RepID=A0A2T2YJR2_9BACT|nr:TIGR03885 family FMN-dependent LLM class oxidoreductase [Adhaeribacter arboris]PSR55747.1 LLM class F420-dependent oxidoreductase [Adhaeribacter arboris]
MKNKVSIGYHISHEQFKPSQLLTLAQQAERAGFTHALSSDHFYPWSEAQGESGFAWSWLGAALQATNLEFGIVNAPGQRYHPAIIAQAVATLCEMFPQRFWLAAGSGQLLNEHITGNQWLAKGARNKRLKESIDIMRALWAGNIVNHQGYVTVQEAKLYTLPAYLPPVMGAAITPATAEWVGSWADGLLTISKPPEELQEVVEAFRRGGGAGKPLYLKVQLSYDSTLEKARQGAHEQWKNNIFPSVLLAEVPTPAGFDAAGTMVKPEEMEPHVRISPKSEDHLKWLQQDIDLGFTRLYLHNVNREQEQFIQTFGQYVLPELVSKE